MPFSSRKICFHSTTSYLLHIDPKCLSESYISKAMCQGNYKQKVNKIEPRSFNPSKNVVSKVRTIRLISWSFFIHFGFKLNISTYNYKNTILNVLHIYEIKTASPAKDLPTFHSMNTFFISEWDLQDIQNTFFKCISWQVEETLDATNCPYHYVCDRTYPANFPPSVDLFLLLFASASYLITLFIAITDMTSGRRERRSPNRYLLPSGPISLPIIILAFAKGSQINTIFPLSSMGPPILQMVLISALSFDYASDKDIKYVFFAASTVSGILHASLYLDSIVLPYYTGLDALLSSTFSGECETCVCRKEALIVGGKVVRYRGWSVTTFTVVSVLCLRIVSRIMYSGGGESENGKMLVVKFLMEKLSWVLIAIDCVYLSAKSPPGRVVLRVSAFGGILLLICLHVLKELCTHIYAKANVAENMRWVSIAVQTK